MILTTARCPKCNGTLYSEADVGGPKELRCLLCGRGTVKLLPVKLRPEAGMKSSGISRPRTLRTARELIDHMPVIDDPVISDSLEDVGL